VVCRVVLGLLIAAASAAQPASKPPDRELVVGVFESPPYAMKGPTGEWRGLTVDLWKELAGTLGATYRLEEKTEPEIVEGLANGHFDLAVGPFAATMERQRIVDFSHTYLNTGLSIVVRRAGRADRLLNLFRTLVTSETGHIIAGIAFLSVLFGNAIWFAERRKNPQFPNHPAHGIGSGVWWAAVTTTGVGYGDKVPITVRGRLIAVTWMVLSIVLYAVLTAGLAAALAVAAFQQVRGTESLRHSMVGALNGSVSADFLRRSQIPHRIYPNLAIAIAALGASKVDAVMGGEATLRYYAARGEGASIEVLPQIFMAEGLAFPLPDGSPLRGPLDAALRKALAGPHYRDLKDRYLSADAELGR
jgi:polar amino acid transport system substrate-binding protein